MDNETAATASIVYSEKYFRTEQFFPELDESTFVLPQKLEKSTLAPVIDMLTLPTASKTLEPTLGTGWAESIQGESRSPRISDDFHKEEIFSPHSTDKVHKVGFPSER